jgi:lysophospholipase L1-like esterase
MDTLTAQYPNVKFIYVTNPLTTSDAAANYARERYNQLVRSTYGSTGRVFDIAAVESTQPNGSRVSGTYGGNTFYSLYSEYSSDGGHLNSAGRSAAAKELLWVIANATR